MSAHPPAPPAGAQRPAKPDTYAQAFHLNPDAVCINRLSDGVFLDLNAGFTAITGYTADEVVGRASGLDLWLTATDWTALLALLAAHGQTSGFEACFRHKSGAFITGLLSARTIDLDGVPCVLATTRDVTDCKRALLALKGSEERFRSLVEMAVDAILIGDQDGNILGANRSAVELTGYPIDELRCLNHGQLFSLEERRRQPLHHELQQQDQVVTTQRRLTRKDGSTVPIEMTTRMLPGGTCHCFLRDISLRLRHETERAQTEQRLGENLKLAALGQLAGGIAHDFNNQLAGIIGNAEMLTRQLEDPRVRHFAERIITAAERSAALTRQLLSFARKGRNVTLALDLHRLIGEVVEVISHSIDKRITVTQRLEASVSTTLGDPDQLQNALLNLAINARDAMPDGGSLTFTSALTTVQPGTPDLELPPGPYLRLAIIDTGVGMDEETRQHLFEPFFTTKKVGKGTGLGLASVYGAVRSHHGAIQVDSRPGHGTTVTIHLPLQQTAGLPPSPVTTIPSSVVTGSGSILLVDDESSIREVTAEMLRSLGYTVLVSADGAAAVEIYGQEWRRIDLVILDLVMPALGGHGAFLAMRAINPGLHALISSGYSMDGEVEELIRLGALGFVPKPFRLAELGEQIVSALHRA